MFVLFNRLDRLVYLEALFAAKAELQRFTEIISL